MCIRDSLREASWALLFFVYVNDVSKLPGTRLAMFADDTAVYAVDRQAEMAVIGLQEQLDEYVDWAERWRDAIKASNCTAEVFSRRLRLPDRLYVGDTLLPWSREVKYLAVHLDHRLTWRTHFAQVARKTAVKPSLSCLLYTSRCV